MGFDLLNQEDPREWVDQQRKQQFEEFLNDEVVGSHCEGCQYDRDPVVYRGDRRADFMVVGDYTAPADQKSGNPFSGPAGDLLEEMLEAIHLDWDRDCYVTNALLCDATETSPKTASVKSCRVNLERQLDLVDPDVVLAMGAYAYQSLYRAPQSESLSDNVGAQGALPERPWIDGVVTFNPAYILRLEGNDRKKVKKLAWDHLQEAQRLYEQAQEEQSESTADD